MMVIVLIGAPISASVFHGAAVLAGLGLTVTFGELARSVISDFAARKGTDRVGASRVQSLVRHTGRPRQSRSVRAPCSAASCSTSSAGTSARSAVSVVGVGVGLIGYVLVQALLGAPELPPRLQLGAARARGATARE